MDAGAAYGHMAWKIIAAGGKVTAIEQQQRAAEILENNLIHKYFLLFLGEDLPYNIRVGDMCDYNLDVYKPDSYDITWSGKVIHFLTPDQTMAYVKNLYKITKPGGYAYATANSYHGTLETNYFQERKSKKEPYPGYFIANYEHQYEYDAINKKNNMVSNEVLSFATARSEVSPAKLHDGIYQGKKSKI